jgi:hypothetical protein
VSPSKKEVVYSAPRRRCFDTRNAQKQLPPAASHRSSRRTTPAHALREAARVVAGRIGAKCRRRDSKYSSLGVGRAAPSVGGGAFAVCHMGGCTAPRCVECTWRRCACRAAWVGDAQMPTVKRDDVLLPPPPLLLSAAAHRPCCIPSRRLRHLHATCFALACVFSPSCWRFSSHFDTTVSTHSPFGRLCVEEWSIGRGRACVESFLPRSIR